MLEYPTILAAFGFGLTSFFSPCTFAMIPTFLSYLALQGSDDNNPSRFRALIGTLWYLLGFLFVYSILGLSVFGFSGFLHDNQEGFLIGSGILIMVMGIIILFGEHIKPLRFLFYEKKLTLSTKTIKRGPLFPIVLGITNAFAWTPCTGPVLTAILALSSTTASWSEGAFFLMIYGLGVTFPLVVMAFFIDSSQKIVLKISPALPWIQKISAILLIMIGASFVFGYDKYLVDIYSDFTRLLGYQ